MTRYQTSILPGLESTDLLGITLPGEDLSTVQLLEQNTRSVSSTNAQRRSRNQVKAGNVIGNNSAENLRGTSGRDRINGQGGNDNIRGKGGNDRLDGGRGNDTINGGGGNDRINGDAGNDTLKGNGGNDKVNGNVGQDTIKGGGGRDTLTGGGGNDTIQGGSGDDRLVGGAGNDDLDGGRGSDRLSGGAGNDILRINDINDIAVGGTGDDRYLLFVALPSSSLVESVGSGTDTVVANFAFRLPTNVENLTLVGVQSNTINIKSLTEVNNALATFVPGSTLAIGQGNASSNVLTGSTVNDILSGEAGNDTANGGLGNDALLGGIGNDRLNGDSGDDFLYGGPGVDTLNGGTGDDLLNGGTESDRLEGGDGNDIYVIQSNATYNLLDDDNDGESDRLQLDEQATGADSIIEQADSGIDTIQASGTVILPSNVENLVLIGGTSLPLNTPFTDGSQFANLFAPALSGSTSYAIGEGNDLNNTLTGNDSNNFLSGEDGQDILNGEGGADILNGGFDNDTLNGGDGDDVILGDVGGSTPTFGNIFLPDLLPEVPLTQSNDTINGGNGNDLLLGGRDNDVLNGGNGDDFFVGSTLGEAVFSFLPRVLSSTEKDILTGGAGGDIFTLGDTNANAIFYGGEGFATITDFTALDGDIIIGVGNVLDYTLEEVQVSGSVALDTQILYEGDVIAVVQDTTDVFPFLNFLTF